MNHQFEHDHRKGITPIDMHLSSAAINPRGMLKDFARMYMTQYDCTVYVSYENNEWNSWTTRERPYLPLGDINAILYETTKIGGGFDAFLEKGIDIASCASVGVRPTHMAIAVDTNVFRAWYEIKTKYM